MGITLRYYQREAKEALYRHFRTYLDNPCIVMPTASGKTLVLASVCVDVVERWNGRIMIVSHVQELLDQSAEKIKALSPALPVGVYSAGLKRADTTQPVIVAGIQSAYRHASKFGHRDVILVDECDLIPTKGDGMYRTFLDAMKKINPRLRVAGLTATPFRLDSGPICTPENILNHVCYEISVRQLLDQGYLCPPVTQVSQTASVDPSGLHVRRGEYVASEVRALVDQEYVVRAACTQIVNKTRDRRATIIFCEGVKHAEHVAGAISRISGDECGLITAGTHRGLRAELIDRFRAGELRYMANVGCLTTGTDVPIIDCVALLRPTMSKRLLIQEVGRGYRLYPGKENFLVLDFAGNIAQHGCIDVISAKPRKKKDPLEYWICKACETVNPKTLENCQICATKATVLRIMIGRKVNDQEPKHGTKPAEIELLSGKTSEHTYPVTSITYRVHTKRNASPEHPKSLRVDYHSGLYMVSDFVFFEHGGWMRRNAEKWWERRSLLPPPETAEEAAELANAGRLAPVTEITVQRTTGEKYDKIIDDVIGPYPEPVEEASRA